MAERSTIARPYAKAAFSYARENGRVADWKGWLGVAREIVSSDEYALLARSPGVQPSQLTDLIVSICADGLDAGGRAFVDLLSENHRIDYLPEIAEQFDALVTDDQNIAEVEIVSAVALDDSQRQLLAGAMRKRLQRDVRLTCTVDPTLIGGAIVKSGDLLIDGSLKGKLERLETELTV